ncbi:hypothetical protein [Beijerinckia sp. L45]|uniref:Cap15 family cyclic dinucleotide receptor domain-containing protein n=1 Tax=Beijerinckia sp. L45 TaxID=1641855 RepID=UPI00131DF8F4|nr:hypothetical protein [Beijerinckia sp. L45]
MNEEHEYAVLGGLNRASIGRYLAVASALIAAGVVYLLLFLNSVWKSHGYNYDIPQSLVSLVTAGSIYLALYWLFSRHAWKLPLLASFLRVPNLSGNWLCDGQTVNADKTLGYKWSGRVTVIQSWDKVRVRLRTPQSGSNSITAALVYDEADGFRLLYNYINEPKIGEPELNAHRGFADLMFNKDLTVAEGEYFNGHGRFTFGTMRWTKEGT